MFQNNPHIDEEDDDDDLDDEMDKKANSSTPSVGTNSTVSSENTRKSV